MKDNQKHMELTIKAQTDFINELIEKTKIYERIIKHQNSCISLLWDVYNDKVR